MRDWRALLRVGVACCIVAASTHVLTLMLFKNGSSVPAVPDVVDADSATVAEVLVELNGESDITLLFVGSPTCGFSKPQDVAPHIVVAFTTLRQKAAQAGHTITAAGIAINADTETNALAYLQEIAAFDRTISGLDAARISIRVPFLGTTPQVLVLERSSTEDVAYIRHRIVGLDGLARWSKAGWRIPNAEWSRTQYQY